MCELFALSSNKRVPASFTWRGFRRHGRLHADGWGIAWYVDNMRAGIAKEPIPAPESMLSMMVARTVRSHIVVNHIRLSSRGSLSYVNTHPFARRLWGRDWVFAHNGTLDGVDGLEEELEWCTPVGETDSERAFCYMLEKLEPLEDAGFDRVVETIWRVSREIGKRGKFNFLISDGTHLYVHMNVEGTLHYATRHPPHRGVVRLLDEDFQVRLDLMKAMDEYAAIIATVPLTDEEWTPMRPWTLYVFRGGGLLATVDERDPRLSLAGEKKALLASARSSPHSTPMRVLARDAGLEPEEAARVAERLVSRGLLRIDRRSRAAGEPLYFTEPMYRPLIDREIQG